MAIRSREGRRGSEFPGSWCVVGYVVCLRLIFYSKMPDCILKSMSGGKYSPLRMFDSKKVVSRMLGEDMERQINFSS